jgi:hypothetical protein
LVGDFEAGERVGVPTAERKLDERGMTRVLVRN